MSTYPMPVLISHNGTDYVASRLDHPASASAPDWVEAVKSLAELVHGGPPSVGPGDNHAWCAFLSTKTYLTTMRHPSYDLVFEMYLDPQTVDEAKMFHSMGSKPSA